MFIMALIDWYSIYFGSCFFCLPVAKTMQRTREGDSVGVCVYEREREELDWRKRLIFKVLHIKWDSMQQPTDPVRLQSRNFITFWRLQIELSALISLLYELLFIMWYLLIFFVIESWLLIKYFRPTHREKYYRTLVYIFGNGILN